MTAMFHPLLGVQSITATLFGSTYTHTVVVPPSATATVGFIVDSDGFVYYQLGAGAPISDYIWRGGGASSLYDVRVTMVSGTTWTGSIGVWANLAVDQGWSLSTGAGVGALIRTGTATVEIREAASGTVLASANVTLVAERTI